ncbi:MAG: DegT/DnrJ/EryC1/StrS aminotransferase family protein [Spirochaetes bacterium]|nr:DegT/DnrJ/EryC1/StrS aminotransferase family protein [Spirochaetota bacterium]
MKIISNKPTITRKDLEAVLDCLIHDELTTGNAIKNLENALSEKMNLQYSLATNTLTAAYHLAFNALQIGEGDEVIIPSFFDPAPLNALSLCGGRAVLADNDQNLPFPSEQTITGLITERTRAVVIGHLFGFHYHKGLLKQASVPVIEDISHAVGTQIDDTPAGSDATFAVASFAASMIITTGNGGMVMTNNSKHYSRMREIRSSAGQYPCYDYGMTDLQGAMGITQLNKLQDMLDRRRQIAKIFYEALKITSHRTLFPYSDSFAFQSFPVLFDASIEKVEKYWKKTGIEVVNPVKTPLHTLMGLNNADYPVSERMAKKLFSIPIYPTLTRDNIDMISRMLSKFI